MYGRGKPDESVVSQLKVSAAFSGLANKYSSFAYNSTNHCYVAEDILFNDSTADYMNVYCENGKFVKIETQFTYDDGYGGLHINSVTYNFSNHGTTTIDVPTWTLQS